MTIQERVGRLKNEIPSDIWMNDEFVDSVRNIPIEERQDFQLDVLVLINRLENHLEWWKKVLIESEKPPTLSVIKDISSTKGDVIQ
jgi:hypothetical protein